MEEEVRSFIREYVESYGVERGIGWRKPLIAFADASDPLFLKLRKVASPKHMLPSQLLADAKTVISYFIPFREEIVLSNAGGGREASREWALAYIETNRLLEDLGEALARWLETLGFKAVPLPPTHNFDEERLVSEWSHKHVAYIAGLG
ncbi:epoxyqueuosine reductase, partial [Candidatus Bathyarchaeota archaeon]